MNSQPKNPPLITSGTHLPPNQDSNMNFLTPDIKHEDTEPTTLFETPKHSLMSASCSLPTTTTAKTPPATTSACPSSPRTPPGTPPLLPLETPVSPGTGLSADDVKTVKEMLSVISYEVSDMTDRMRVRFHYD